MPQYIHRPLPVFAMQYTGDNAEKIKQHFPSVYYADNECLWLYIKGADYGIELFDYIIRHHAGNISVMSKEEFEERYERKND